jgi:predicted MFS family arabinose efflux permease
LRTIAFVSVTSTIGVGVGYPLAGLLSELGGVRAAYGLGVAVSVVAFVAAWRHVPAPPPGRSARLDLAGALLLMVGLFPLLLVVSQTGLWSEHLGIALALTAVAAILLAVWAAYELRVPAPLVDIRLLRHRAVAGANVAMLVGGAGMYLLLTLITRYAQTPRRAGYGFALSTFEAGLVLVPFSVMGFLAGRLTPPLHLRIGAGRLLAAGASVVLAGFVLFALARSHLALVLVSMGVLGFGVGSFSAAMPAAILAVTPTSETSSAMSFNGLVRSTGFSLGSALGGLVLAASTGAGRAFPANGGYTLAAWVGVAAMTLTALTSLVVGRSAPRAGSPSTSSPGPV